MDFLEGALLGPLWSDTDYEDRSHVLLGVGYIVFVYACVFWLLRRAKSPFLFTGYTSLVWLALTVFLLVTSSYLASRYYRTGLVGRFAILGGMFCKYLVATGFLVSCFRPVYALRLSVLKDSLLHFLDGTVGDFVFQASERFRITGLILSGLLAGILLLVAFLALLVILIWIPILFLRVLRWIQSRVDEGLLRITNQTQEK